MSKILMTLLALLGLVPHYVAGGLDEGGGATDRGDDFTPTDDDDDKREGADADNARAADKAGVDDLAAKAAAAKDKADDKGDKADDKTKRRDDRIPLKRHEEILAKERERRQVLETQLAATRSAAEVASTNEAVTKLENSLAPLEEKYAKALTDGDPAAVTAALREIRKVEGQISQARLQFETQAAEARAYERARYDAAVDRIEEAFPQLKDGSPEYDADLDDQVTALMQGYLSRGGYTKTAALQKAVQVVMKPQTRDQKRAAETDVRVDKEDVAAKLAEERRAAARTKAADTINKSPADLDGGIDSDKVGGSGKLTAKEVIRMDPTAFSKLTERELALARGDEL